MKFNIYFDGGTKESNPGKMYGSFEVSGETFSILKKVDFESKGTNNEAEYLAMISGIKELLNRLKENNLDSHLCRVDIYSDSRLVVNQLQGHYKINFAHLKKLHKQSLELLSNFKIWSISWNTRLVNVEKFGH